MYIIAELQMGPRKNYGGGAASQLWATPHHHPNIIFESCLKEFVQLLSLCPRLKFGADAIPRCREIELSSYLNFFNILKKIVPGGGCSVDSPSNST